MTIYFADTNKNVNANLKKQVNKAREGTITQKESTKKADSILS